MARIELFRQTGAAEDAAIGRLVVEVPHQDAIVLGKVPTMSLI